MPTRPASRTHTATNGMSDQNMSRPSCSTRGFVGLGPGGPASGSAGRGSPSVTSTMCHPPRRALRRRQHAPVSQVWTCRPVLGHHPMPDTEPDRLIPPLDSVRVVVRLTAAAKPRPQPGPELVRGSPRRGAMAAGRWVGRGDDRRAATARPSTRCASWSTRCRCAAWW